MTGSLLLQSGPSTLEARIDAIVQAEILAKGVPSVSVAVMRDGKVLYVDGSVAYAMLYNAGPRTPGISDLIPRVVLGVPPAEKSK